MKLELKNISKTYGKTLALENFSATFNEGIYALLGPNGSGKTTLMNIITDNLKADTGDILYSEDAVKPSSIYDKKICFRQNLGFMPQYPGMYPNFTARQFLQYVATLKGVGVGFRRHEQNALIEKQILDILYEVELIDVCDKKIKTFSGGMKQRLALAQAVLGDPKILILDEPTAGLDPKQRISVRNYISRIALNKIVIIATHVVSDVEFIAKEIIMLKKGKIIEMEAPQKLLQKITGNVWEICVNETEIPNFQATFAITSISKSDKNNGEVALRVLSESKPLASAKLLTPSLEDYYLLTFGNKSV